MKKWQAILAHAGVGAVQAVIGDPTVSANPYFSTGLQLGLTMLQIYMAKKNSETNDQGQPVRKFDPNILSDIQKRQSELGNPNWPNSQ